MDGESRLQPVDVGTRSLSAYRGVAPDDQIDALIAAAEDLRGARVLHLNATPYGGGVSELLRSTVPLLADLGLDVEWRVIGGDEQFFTVTKAIHNALQGQKCELTETQREIYLRNAERNAAALHDGYDFVFAHDPQPAAMLSFHSRNATHWVWRCHIDTSSPNQGVWEFLREHLTDYSAAVFTMREFIPPGFPVASVDIVPPAIDPLSPKNFTLPESISRQVLDWIGVELNRPLITQVSRFDPWKDPLGVIEAYRLVREEVPNLQLALVGSMALDDPEGWNIYSAIADTSRDDPLIHVFTNLTGVGNIEVNAFQRLSDVVVQKSIREGFGLVVSEAMWKKTPVVAGRAGGIPLQMADGVGGLLVESVDETAAALGRLLTDSRLSAELGHTGHDRVREHFLLPRVLLDEVRMMKRLAGLEPAMPPGGREACDPVCGMHVARTATTPSVTIDGSDYVFCSRKCRDRFIADPAAFAAGPSGGEFKVR